MHEYEYIMTSNGELYHHGVKGMKWGKRKARQHAGPGRYIGAKRQLAGDKRDLKTLENGGHLSVGFTKKRQAAFDKRDKALIEKRIAKNEAKIKNAIKSKTSGEFSARGKAALDVLMNGDKDWMGNSIGSDDVVTEARNRGKAALERLMYSQERIDNKKFFGSYDPFD